VLGICYGMQLTSHLLGGRVAPCSKREYGKAELIIDANDDLFKDFEPGGAIQVWMSHGDRLEIVPPGFESIGHSGNSPLAAMRNKARRIYGVQFHPEVVHTPGGVGFWRISFSPSAAASLSGP
jgi:GMP synthase (glutamine-hydrolysing)